AKTPYMTHGQVSLPLVIRTANGGGSRFGAQHSQSVENWAMAVPGLKAVAPSTPADVKGLIAAAIRDPDPVIVFEHKSLYPTKGEVPGGELVDRLGTARVVRDGNDLTIVALAAMVPRAVEAAARGAVTGGWDGSPRGRPTAGTRWSRRPPPLRPSADEGRPPAGRGRCRGRSCRDGFPRAGRPPLGDGQARDRRPCPACGRRPRV